MFRLRVTNFVSKLGFASGILGCAMLLGIALGPVPGLAKGPDSATAFQTVAPGELPKQARETYELIGRGGPFPYQKDGVVFGNRERYLPAHKRGYYHEYTVKTPGSRDRGARRIVCGSQQATAPEVCYYSDDHYASFRRIVP